MKKHFFALVLALASGSVLASGGPDIKLEKVDIDLSDKASLQRGARTFVNYCLSCHSAGYMRYNRMGQDLGLTEEQVKGNLMFASDKVGEFMKATMPAAEAKRWFGTAPPDLSLTTRSRTPDWLYTYLLSFYRDEQSATGWDNRVFPKVAMPHVLAELQGVQRPVYRKVTHKQGGQAVDEQVFERFEIARAGTMSEKEYNATVRDLVNFMTYLGEPAKLERGRIGVFVLLFLAVLLVVSYLLKKEYWRDVH